MIELNVKDYCQECGHFEPDVYKNVLTAKGYIGYRTIISCQNRTSCEIIQRYLEDRIKRDSQEKQTS